jgi:hypothetical protein
MVLISVLHSLTPVGVNPDGFGNSEGFCCKQIVIDFLDSETVYCIHLTSAPLSYCEQWGDYVIPHNGFFTEIQGHGGYKSSHV